MKTLRLVSSDFKKKIDSYYSDYVGGGWSTLRSGRTPRGTLKYSTT